MDPLAAIRTTFFLECEEQLADLEAGLTAVTRGDRDPETVNAVFRAVHSIKGGAGAFGLEDLVGFAHAFESTLDEVRSGRLVASPEGCAVMLRATDALADLVRCARDGGVVQQVRNSALAAELAGIGCSRDDPPEDVDLSQSEDAADFVFRPVQVVLVDEALERCETWEIGFRPRAELYAKANETALLMRELARLGETAVECDASRLPGLADLDPSDAYLAWTVILETSAAEEDIREVFEFVDGDCELTIVRRGADRAGGSPLDAVAGAQVDLGIVERIRRANAGAEEIAAAARPAPVPRSSAAAPAGQMAGRPDPAAQTTIRVDLARVDRLIDLAGELAIVEAALLQRVHEAGLARASGVAMALDELDRLTREIQDGVMSVRAQPVRSVFQRMSRLVREVSATTGKPVRLVTEGEDVEVDTTVIERLADPLTHMIRNAVDHGLESPAQRLAAGKPVEGVVRLCAAHRSGRIVIEVGDDGAGIDRPRVRRIAVEKGLIGALAAPGEEEIDDLIFRPGFSTAAEVSDLSGRGVGMDVVRLSVQALGGRISIASRPGEGSVFTLSLPLTLAVLEGMVVTVAGQTLVAPLGAVVETLRPRTQDVYSLGGGAQVIATRGGYAPLVDTGSALGYRATPASLSEGVALLVEGSRGARAVLLVDAIQGQRRVVMKSLEANYGRVPRVAGATVMGDGRVALILDIDALVDLSRVGSVGSEACLAQAG